MPPTLVNLSNGTIAWKHWGLEGVAEDSMISPFQSITMKQIGTASLQSYSNNPNAFSWDNGTPHLRVDSTTTGIFVEGINNGFAIIVPASTKQQTLKVEKSQKSFFSHSA